MVLIEIGVLSGHVKVIKSNIGPESVEKCRANFRKKAKGIVLKPFFQTPLFFFETESSLFKTFYKHYALNILKNMQISFCLYFNKYKVLEL
jgi:hypothetical protein